MIDAFFTWLFYGLLTISWLASAAIVGAITLAAFPQLIDVAGKWLNAPREKR